MSIKRGNFVFVTAFFDRMMHEKNRDANVFRLLKAYTPLFIMRI